MTRILESKFLLHNPELSALLKATAPRDLVEANKWSDTYWGLDLRKQRGANHLGEILMNFRDQL